MPSIPLAVFSNGPILLTCSVIVSTLALLRTLRKSSLLCTGSRLILARGSLVPAPPRDPFVWVRRDAARFQYPSLLHGSTLLQRGLTVMKAIRFIVGSAVLITVGSACSPDADQEFAAEEPVIPAGLPTLPEPQGDWEWLQSFDVDDAHWYEHREGTLHVEASGFTAEYASGISSSTGPQHARLRNPQGEGCVPEFTEETRCGGPFTPWGRPPVPNPDWPEGGYFTTIDIYLDGDWARGNPDRRFDFSSAINRAGDGSHHRDFLFNVGTDPDGAGSWTIGTSITHGRANSNPANPCPEPSDGRNSCRSPVTVSETGWYRFQHTFRPDEGDLTILMEVFAPDGEQVGAWTIYDIPMEGVGGEHYGWFSNQEIFDLAIDNSGKFFLER